MAYIVVGRFGKAHGIKGAITIQSFTEPADNILQYRPWFIKRGNVWEEVRVDNVEQLGKQLIAWLDQVTDRDQASALTNLEIAVSESVLPKLPEGEYYWQQLIGLSVTNLNKVFLGTVTEIIATGANDVIVIEGERRHLVPFLVGRYIQSIDLESREMIVDWDETF
ncbi:ribosome maturation factor RimM [Legionella sp. W05-934-2]|uniref:ribosome maturation factor RimM n=1 Tax=Legionella sp. W05-934-2 TaxID=1198649 RepID=UPI003462032E